MSAAPGRLLLALAGLTLPLCSFIADWNDSHVFNPRWRPHAVFHTGQTLSFSVVLGLLTLYYLFSPLPSPAAASAAERALRKHIARQRLDFAALLAGMYWVTQVAAMFYPNSMCIDPELGEGCPQRFLDAAFLAVVVAGWALEASRLGGGSGHGVDNKEIQ